MTAEPTRAGRVGDQQLPHTGAVDVGPEVIKDVRRYEDFRNKAIVASVVHEFEARIALGIERYGHPLQTENGRDPARDALDELLDAAHYLKQWHLETRSPKAHVAYMVAIGLVFDLKETMMPEAKTE